MTNIDESQKRIAAKKIGIIAGSIAGGLVIIYLGFSLFFMNHFFFRTTVNGMKVSTCSASGVLKKAEKSVEDFILIITARDGSTYTIAGKDFDLNEEWDDKIKVLVKKQNGFTWPGKLFSENELELNGVVSYDEEKLKSLLDELEFMDEANQTEAVNAGISDYSEEDGFSIVPAVEGTQIDEEGLMAAVEEALLRLDENVSLADDGCYLEPEIGNDDEALLDALENMNKWISTVITYQIGDDTQVLDASVFHDWISLSKKCKASIDKDQVADYVAYLAKTYNTCYSAKKLKTTWGETVTINNSHYGWKVDNEAEAAQIIKDIKAGGPVTRDLTYSMTANSHGDNDYGDSYVEINLTAQHLYLYKDGKMVLESDFVSGNVSRGNGTPSGAFSLTYKQKDAVLKGQNYATPVDYWMPFYGNYGMHDASWRSKFGGTIYRSNGSHGCVNLPRASAEKIFEVVDKNYPVLVYELAGTEAKKEEEKKDSNEDQITEVINAIKSAVGSDPSKVTLDDEKAITSARSKYDALSSSAKSSVTNYDSLKKAESRMKELKEADKKSTEEESTEKKSSKKKSTESTESTSKKKSTESTESSSKKKSTESTESSSKKKSTESTEPSSKKKSKESTESSSKKSN